jgi:hypothetical protein
LPGASTGIRYCPGMSREVILIPGRVVESRKWY